MQEPIYQFEPVHQPHKMVSVNNNYLGDRIIFIPTESNAQPLHFKRTHMIRIKEHNTQYEDINKAKEVKEYYKDYDKIQGVVKATNILPAYDPHNPLFI